jgi:hypothetical protein
VSPETHFPDPNGPGMHAVPPLAIGKKVSMTRWPVRRGMPGASFCWTGRGIRTTHLCDRKTGTLPEVVRMEPIGSRIV